LICLAVLVLLPCGALLPGILGTHVPMDLREALFEAPWQEARPDGIEPAPFFLAREQGRRIYSEFAFLNRAARNHESLLWNSDEAAGAPFLAVWRTRVFSPFSLPFHFLPLHQAMVWSLLLKMMAAGFCAWYVSRRLGFPPALALFAATAFQFSAPVYVWGALPIADVIAWLPLLLMFAERLALGQLRAWPLGAVAAALMAVGGDPAALVTLFLFAAVYLILRARGQGQGGRMRGAIGSFLAALALGLALAGVQLAPYFEFMAHGAADAAAPPALRLAHLTALLAPSLASAREADAVPLTALLYPGTVSLFLLALWFAVRRFTEEALRRRFEGLLLTAALFGIAGLVAAYAGHTALTPPLLCAGGLVLAWIAAAALEEWHELNAEQCKAALARLLWAAPALLALLFLALLLRAGHIEAVYGAWRAEAAAAAVSVALIAALVLFTLFRPNLRVAGYGAVALTACSLWWVLGGIAPMTPVDHVFPETAFIRELRAADTRISGSEGVARWPLAAHGIQQLRNPGGVALHRYNAFMDIVRRDPLMLRRAGSRYLLLTKDDIQGNFASVRPELGIRHVFSSGAVLFEDHEAKPRAWMAYVWRPVESFEPDIIGWNRLPTMETPLLPEKSDGADAEAVIDVRDEGALVRVRVDTPRRGVLVLADAWYPGWRVTIDGAPTDSFPVDGLFRGVRVSEGAHEIVFRYQPQSLVVGLAISGVAGIIVLYGLARLALERLRAAPSM